MDLNDNDLYNSTEKEVNLSKNDHSLLIKSVEDTDFNFLDFLKDKQLLSITFKDMILQISNKSIIKIFTLLTNDEDGDNIENNLTNYITCLMSDDNLSYNKDATTNSIGVLETPFKKLLDKTKNYKINIVTSKVDEIKKELLNYAQQKNKIDIKSKSIDKICKYLNKSIYDISDYINIVIIYDDEDYDKELLKQKLIDKYDKIGENIYFIGVKKFITDFSIPPKNNKNSIYRINILFNNVLNKIDSVENNSFDDSDSEYNKKGNKNYEIINNSNKYNEINIKYEINNNDHKIDDDEKNELQLTDDGTERKGGCKKEFCPNCSIF